MRNWPSYGERESVRDEIKAKEADGQQVDLFTFLDILRKNGELVDPETVFKFKA